MQTEWTGDYMALLRRWRESEDADAREALIAMFAPLVKATVAACKPWRSEIDDYTQIGIEGLLQAIEKFDLERGVAFPSFAKRYVQGHLWNWIRDHGCLLKLSRRLSIERSPWPAVIVFSALQGVGEKWEERFSYDDSNLDAVEDYATLWAVFGTLPEREQVILMQTIVQGENQRSVAKAVGVSQMHVGRLRKQALARLREGLSAA